MKGAHSLIALSSAFLSIAGCKEPSVPTDRDAEAVMTTGLSDADLSPVVRALVASGLQEDSPLIPGVSAEFRLNSEKQQRALSNALSVENLQLPLGTLVQYKPSSYRDTTRRYQLSDEHLRHGAVPTDFRLMPALNNLGDSGFVARADRTGVMAALVFVDPSSRAYFSPKSTFFLAIRPEINPGKVLLAWIGSGESFFFIMPDCLDQTGYCILSDDKGLVALAEGIRRLVARSSADVQ